MSTPEPRPPAPPKPPRRVVYIGGYGRSGSTLLGRVFAEKRNVLHLGEVHRGLPKARKHGRMCTCGRTVAECPAWGTSRKRRARMMRKGGLEGHAGILRSMLKQGRWRTVVDSSKTAWGHASDPIRLKPLVEPYAFTLVHLVRDPRGVLWSVLRERAADRRSSVFAQAWHAISVSVGWCYANYACLRFQRRFPEDYVRVRYEHAIRHGLPQSLARLAPTDPLRGKRIENKFDNHHALAGNRMRRSDEIAIELDDAWRRDMPRSLSLAVLALTWPLRRLYRTAPSGPPLAHNRERLST